MLISRAVQHSIAPDRKNGPASIPVFLEFNLPPPRGPGAPPFPRVDLRTHLAGAIIQGLSLGCKEFFVFRLPVFPPHARAESFLRVSSPALNPRLVLFQVRDQVI